MVSKLRWSAALAVTLVTLAGGIARAQAPTTLPATKLGVVNVGLLFTKYKKAELFKKELEGELAPLKKQADDIKAVMKSHQEWLQKNATKDMAQAEKSQQALRDGQRALEDLDVRARKLVGTKQETQLIQLYKEIQVAVQSYGQQNGYHLIFAYGEPPDQDLFTFPNVNRKMNAMDMGASLPLYVQAGLDVSADVLARLNAPFAAAGAAPPTGIIPVSNQK